MLFPQWRSEPMAGGGINKSDSLFRIFTFPISNFPYIYFFFINPTKILNLNLVPYIYFKVLTLCGVFFEN